MSPGIVIVTKCASYLCRFVTMCVQRPAHLLLADNPAALLQPHSADHHLARQSFEHANMFYLVCHFCLDFTDVAVKDMYQLMMPKGGVARQVTLNLQLLQPMRACSNSY